MYYGLLLGMVNSVKVIFFLLGSAFILMKLVQPLEEMILMLNDETTDKEEVVSCAKDIRTDDQEQAVVVQDYGDGNNRTVRKAVKLR